MHYPESTIEGPFGKRKKSHSKNFLGKQVLIGSFERQVEINISVKVAKFSHPLQDQHSPLTC